MSEGGYSGLRRTGAHQISVGDKAAGRSPGARSAGDGYPSWERWGRRLVSRSSRRACSACVRLRDEQAQWINETSLYLFVPRQKLALRVEHLVGHLPDLA